MRSGVAILRQASNVTAYRRRFGNTLDGQHCSVEDNPAATKSRTGHVCALALRANRAYFGFGRDSSSPCDQLALDFCQKRTGRYSKAIGNSQDQGKRRLPLSTLQLSEIGAIDVRDERELVLGNLPLHALSTHDRPEGRGDLRLKRCGASGCFGSLN